MSTDSSMRRREHTEEADRDTTLILVRHGETAWNAEGRVQGQQNSPLSDRGRQQGELVAERLSHGSVHAVYSSDLARARETAELIAAPHGLTVKLGSALRERNYGVLEGKTIDEAARTQGIWFFAWQANRLHHAPPGGENQPDMCHRVMEALRAIAGAHEGETVVVVTHGGPIKSAVYDVLRIPLSLWGLTWVTNGSITTLRGTPDVFRIVCVNDTCHLGPAYPQLDQMED